MKKAEKAEVKYCGLTSYFDFEECPCQEERLDFEGYASREKREDS